MEGRIFEGGTVDDVVGAWSTDTGWVVEDIHRRHNDWAAGHFGRKMDEGGTRGYIGGKSDESRTRWYMVVDGKESGK